MTEQPKPAHIKTWDEWMPALKLEMPIDQFRRLPRNPAYKYEYLEGQAFLTPCPKHFHSILKIAEFAAPPKIAPVCLRHLDCRDMGDFPSLFAAAFQNAQPFSGLSEDECRQAAQESLTATLAGKDGPLLDTACFTALEPETERPVGSILITQIIGGDPSDHESYTWPAVCVPGEKGQAHLTWIFVAPSSKRTGVGSALLAASVAAIATLGHTELWSTFLLGNDSSMMWHWRNGFRLVSGE